MKIKIIGLLLLISLSFVHVSALQINTNEEYGTFVTFFTFFPDSVKNSLLLFPQIDNEITQALEQNPNKLTSFDLNDQLYLEDPHAIIEAAEGLEQLNILYNNQAGWSSVITPQFFYGQDIFGNKIKCQGWDRYKSVTANIEGVGTVQLVVEGQDGVMEAACIPV